MPWVKPTYRLPLTSAGTATPTTLRLRLHSVGAHAANVRAKIESMRNDEVDLEAVAAEIIGRIVLEFSGLELSLNLCLQWAVNAKDFHAVNPLVERLSFKNKTDALVEIVEIKFPSSPDCVSDFKSWHKKVDKFRSKRNSFIHGRWGYGYASEEIINVSPGMIGPGPSKEKRYSVESLNAELNALKEISKELNAIRERWRV